MAGLHTLKRTGKRPSMRVGRGGTRGKTSGRGTKGQNARAGRKKRPEMRDIIKRLPKRRGYGKNRGRTVRPKADAVAISLTRVNNNFDAGSEVNYATLLQKGLINRTVTLVKVVAGEISKKLVFKGVPVTASAKSAIEKAGGSVVE